MANPVTVANAFDVISVILDNTTDEDIITASRTAGLPANISAFRNKFATMNKNAHKTSPRKHAPSKASIRNANDARTFASAHESGDVVTLDDVTAVLPTRITSQSCVPVINVLLADGTVSRGAEKVDGHVSYVFN